MGNGGSKTSHGLDLGQAPRPLPVRGSGEHLVARGVGEVQLAGEAPAPDVGHQVDVVCPGKRPGEYPSGGPLPHLLDVWKVAAPSLDFLAPDIYFPNFSEWVRHYARSDNPLFIPEANHARLPQAGDRARAAGYWGFSLGQPPPATPWALGHRP